MGIDIYAFPERLVDGRYETDLEYRYFHWRQRDMWAFLGGWKSGVGIPPLAEERGVPPDGLRVAGLDDDEQRAVLDGGAWLSVRELLDIDYDATFVGTFRIMGENEDGSFSYELDPEAATEITFRRFLGPASSTSSRASPRPGPTASCSSTAEVRGRDWPVRLGAGPRSA